MDNEKDKQKDNPFFGWGLRHAKPNSVIFVPDGSVVPALMKKWNLKVADFPLPALKRYNEYHSVYVQVIESIMTYWSNPVHQYNIVAKTATIGKLKVAVAGSLQLQDFQLVFVKGWACTPELTTILLRLVRGNGGNGGNPFAKLALKIKNREETCFPDITYIPQLLAELEVQSFEDLNLLETGDWPGLWKGVSFTGFRASRDGLIATFKHGGGVEIIHLLWADESKAPPAYYISILPQIVIRRLKATIAHNKGSMPKKWTRDTFQAMTKHLQGKDLVALCLSDKNFGQLCQADDQAIFRRKLMEEFGIDYFQNDHGFESPMLLYKQAHIYYMYVRLELPAKGPDESNTYVLDKISGNRNRIPLPISERLVTLVSQPDDPPGAAIHIIFFPTIPELSFYVICTFQKGNYVVIMVRETNGIKQYLDDEEIKIFAQSLVDIYEIERDSSLLSMPAYDDVDASWYSDISGDRDIRVYTE